MSETPSAPRVEADWKAVCTYRQAMDDLLEEHQASGRDLIEALEEMLEQHRQDMGAESAALKLLADPEDRFSLDQVLRAGEMSVDPQDVAGWGEDGDLRHYTSFLDVGDEVLGALTLGLRGPKQDSDEWVERFAHSFVEQVDNVVFQVRQASREHRLGVHLSLCLETPVLEEGLDEAMAILASTLPVDRILFFYRNTHRLYPEQVAYRLYDHAGTVHANSTSNPDPVLASLVEGKMVSEIDTQDLPSDWSNAEIPARLMPLIHAGRAEEVMGKFFYWLKPGGNVRAARQMLEVLRSAIIQRLADFSKDARNLEKYFARETVYRLLMEEDYEALYLTPKVQTVGVLFIDVAGFTRLSETALKRPEDTGRFIDLWSEGAARILMQHGGVMDKLIGDCVLGLFGPPFFARTEAQLAESTIRAALEIQDFTRALIDDEGLADLKEALLDAGGLDVSTGAAMGPAAAGLFGPNRDYTAFGSVMNNCARIQGAAKPGQTLALKELVAALEGHEVEDFGFGETGEYKAKNVAEPLVYQVVERSS